MIPRLFFSRYPGKRRDACQTSAHNLNRRRTAALAGITLVSWLVFTNAAFADMTEEPVVKLQALDKVSARTVTFDAHVGATVKFGSVYIKPQACRKASPLDQPEAAAFLQIWEVTPKTTQSHWVFSGWMFASSPALSAMDHPIYDVWVLDCVEAKASTASLVPPLPSIPAADSKTTTTPPAASADGAAQVATPAAASATTPGQDQDDDSDDKKGDADDGDADQDDAAPATPETVSPATAPPPMDDTHQPVSEAPNPSSMY